MQLCGPPDTPPIPPPDSLLDHAALLDDRFRLAAAALGSDAVVKTAARLVERAEMLGHRRAGRTSCGGATRLLPTADGRWLAVSLARPSDVGLLAAWRGDGLPRHDAAADADVWSAVSCAVRSAPAVDLVAQGVLLGLPVALVDELRPDEPLTLPTLVAAAPRRESMRGVVVADLSALWAGPLCGALLASAGADVVKVESVHRQDGARSGPPAFFDAMNAMKRSLHLDFRSSRGRAELVALLGGVDVVIEASRPRALAQLGIDAKALLAAGGPKVWLSITAYGRAGAPADRVGFGDDAAAAGGLVVWDDTGPYFCGDAIADPLTGVTGAVAVLEHLARPGTWMLDVALGRTAAVFAGRRQADSRSRSR